MSKPGLSAEVSKKQKPGFGFYYSSVPLLTRYSINEDAYEQAVCREFGYL